MPGREKLAEFVALSQPHALLASPVGIQLNPTKSNLMMTADSQMSGEEIKSKID